MPGFDRTGPAGQGPRSGRGLGKCGGVKRAPRSDFGQPQQAIPDNDPSLKRGSGRGFAGGAGGGSGRGRGRGRI
jgi:hypothetical protein